jgi:hypothetical protein
MLYAYTENTLNGKISTKTVYISVNNNSNFKIFLILSIYAIWDRLSQKPSHATAPLMGFLLRNYADNFSKIYCTCHHQASWFKKTYLNKKHEGKNNFFFVQSVFMADGTQGNGLCQSNQFFYLQFLL